MSPNGSALLTYTTAERREKVKEPVASGAGQAPSGKRNKDKEQMQKSLKRRSKVLMDLLFSLDSTPEIEIFLLFDMSRYDQLNLADANESKRLKDKLPRLRRALQRKYPNCWFIYRWLLETSVNGRPVVKLNLIGDTKSEHSVEEISAFIVREWGSIEHSMFDNLALVREAHSNSITSFISGGNEPHLQETFILFLNNSYSHGVIGKKNVRTKQPTVYDVSEHKLKKITELLKDEHVEYFGKIGRNPNRRYKNMLDANHGRSIMNPDVYKKVMKILGE